MDNDVLDFKKDANEFFEKELNKSEELEKDKKNILREVILSDSQKKSVLQRINDTTRKPPALKELVEMCFGAGIDGRDKRARLVKEYCASLDFKPRTSYEYQYRSEGLELTESQKQYIANNASSMKAYEMAREVFNEPHVTQTSMQARVVAEYVRTLPKQSLYEDIDDVPQQDYKPPGTINKAIRRVNKYIHNSGLETEDKLNPKQKRQMSSLISYLHSYRFTRQMKEFESVNDRTLLESNFVSNTYNKEDLTQEDLDQYITLAIEVVLAASILRRLEMLKRALDKEVEDEDDPKIKANLVEALDKVQREYNDSIKRQNDLYSALTKKRSKRLDEKVAESASLLNLIEYWRNAEKRRKMIELAELRRKAIKDEIERLRTMDDLKVQVWGVSSEEV